MTSMETAKITTTSSPHLKRTSSMASASAAQLFIPDQETFVKLARRKRGSSRRSSLMTNSSTTEPHCQFYSNSTPTSTTNITTLNTIASAVNKKKTKIKSDSNNVSVNGIAMPTNGGSSASVTTTAKVQGRPLAARTKVRFAMVQDLKTLYEGLTHGPNRRPIEILKENEQFAEQDIISSESLMTQITTTGNNYGNRRNQQFEVKQALFIEKESIDKDDDPLTKDPDYFESIDTAIESLFGMKDYTLLRITRAAACEPGGTVPLKLESAMPGNTYLNDDEFDDEDNNMSDPSSGGLEQQQQQQQQQQSLHAIRDPILGQVGDRPSPTFLKKKVARPRYKSGMRMYVIPKKLDVVMYMEERMLKRDLLKNVLNISQDKRTILCCFDPYPVLEEVEKLRSHHNSIANCYHQIAADSSSISPSASLSMPQTTHSLSLPDLKAVQHYTPVVGIKQQPFFFTDTDFYLDDANTTNGNDISLPTQEQEDQLHTATMLFNTPNDDDDFPSSAVTTDLIKQGAFFERFPGSAAAAAAAATTAVSSTAASIESSSARAIQPHYLTEVNHQERFYIDPNGTTAASTSTTTRSAMSSPVLQSAAMMPPDMISSDALKQEHDEHEHEQLQEEGEEENRQWLMQNQPIMYSGYQNLIPTIGGGHSLSTAYDDHITSLGISSATTAASGANISGGTVFDNDDTTFTNINTTSGNGNTTAATSRTFQQQQQQQQQQDMLNNSTTFYGFSFD